MRKFYTGWLVAISFFPTACGNHKPVTVKETLQQMSKVPGINAGTGTFDIHTPAGWTRTDKKISGISVAAILAPKIAGAPFQSSITVITTALSNASFDKFFDGIVSEAEQTMQVAEKGDKNINGLPCKYVKFSGASHGQPIDAIQYAIPGGNGIVYVLTCGTPRGQMEKYQTDFEAAVNSFQVHGMVKVSK